MAGETRSTVNRVYKSLRAMAVNYTFKPGERLNEVELSAELQVSRTPLREALNRLNMEGFLIFIPGRGFFCRQLDVKEVSDLYEARSALERAGIALSIQHATESEIAALDAFLDETGPEPGSRTAEELVTLDETFHERLIAMSGNAEFTRILGNINSRIRFVRWIEMDNDKRSITQAEHRNILALLGARDLDECDNALRNHIARRTDQITASIKEGYARLYMPAHNAESSN